ncbi:hypothetical protein A2954_04810 [Candidatus Roizmanbacteria bacterium RIFCSPLOWO2_01_FULL_37_12]|uniref:Bacterial sugar transferase domain-containing protein n=1 Tax=Candidatus Roizmanbacteria bacterium RIFCSPLOWO2_01_FULL_37_12 TaxID=1802056 RepID=A0A1F7IG31_9BACT|nr:MAG: hypothetical protein A2768_00825 [Candidatus Roizmanbacteria bacterium RIFCSPHIGHO2_01_FULL_37_16]OGK24302.1 MAG: hypothetical protein A3D76_02580 [Candidatus Roizmanbacteria bacterium RIFCSPHIGHO2_02_FULL_37_9b]OGK42300.1 MAG: hypothetical protein A2954_04810 [Candidatus Roizmanbacteria bacterium RIFCSPLOWO2_01_FULL_37_12]
MRENSDRGPENSRITKGLLPEEDPRNTQLGKFMRKYQLEELPQLFSVIDDMMSLVGIRMIPNTSINENKQKWSKKRHEMFINFYKLFGASLYDSAQAMTGNLVNGVRENHFHQYLLYYKNASLSLDLFLLWRTFLNDTRLVEMLDRRKTKV